MYNFIFLVEYDKGQEPYLLKTCQHGIKSKSNYLIALSPDGRTIAVAPTNASDLYIYSAVTGELQAELKEIHHGTFHFNVLFYFKMFCFIF